MSFLHSSWHVSWQLFVFGVNAALVVLLRTVSLLWQMVVIHPVIDCEWWCIYTAYVFNAMIVNGDVCILCTSSMPSASTVFYTVPHMYKLGTEMYRFYPRFHVSTFSVVEIIFLCVCIYARSACTYYHRHLSDQSDCISVVVVIKLLLEHFFNVNVLYLECACRCLVCKELGLSCSFIDLAMK